MTEDQLEQQCLDWFRKVGWEIAHGADIAPDGDTPERRDFRQVLLLGDLHAALPRINPHLPRMPSSMAGHFVQRSQGLSDRSWQDQVGAAVD